VRNYAYKYTKMSTRVVRYGIIPSIGPFRTFGPIFSYFSSTQKRISFVWNEQKVLYCFVHSVVPHPTIWFLSAEVCFVHIYIQCITFGHMLSRQKGCQFLTLLTVYPQLDHFVLLDLYFLTFHLPKKEPYLYEISKSIVLFRTAIWTVYCFVSKGIWFACFRECVFFIGTWFSNLYTAFPDETEIKELKFGI
jgi:hypothetical protein